MEKKLSIIIWILKIKEIFIMKINRLKINKIITNLKINKIIN